MTNMKLLAVVSFCAAAACTAPPARTEASESVAPASKSAAEVAAEQAAIVDRSRQTIYGTNEAKSPFERETVIRLNAIVQRSLDAINEFDGRRAEIIAAADAAAAGDDKARIQAEDGISFINGLYDRAKKALDDLKVAENDVKTSGEDYNAAILAGMVTFSTKVEAELRKEREDLAAKLSASPAN